MNNYDNSNFTAFCTIVILVYDNNLDFWKRNKNNFDILVLFLQDVLYPRYISEDWFYFKGKSVFFNYTSFQWLIYDKKKIFSYDLFFFIIYFTV